MQDYQHYLARQFTPQPPSWIRPKKTEPVIAVGTPYYDCPFCERRTIGADECHSDECRSSVPDPWWLLRRLREMSVTTSQASRIGPQVDAALEWHDRQTQRRTAEEA